MNIRIFKLKNNINITFSGNTSSKNTFIVIESFKPVSYGELITSLKKKYPNKFIKLRTELSSNKNEIVYTYFPFVNSIREIKFNTGFYPIADLAFLKTRINTEIKNDSTSNG